MVNLPKVTPIVLRDSRAGDDGLFIRAYNVLVEAVGGEPAAQKLGITEKPTVDLANALGYAHGERGDVLPDHTWTVPGKLTQDGQSSWDSRTKTKVFEFELADEVATLVRAYMQAHQETSEGAVSSEYLNLKDDGRVTLQAPARNIVNAGAFKK